MNILEKKTLLETIARQDAEAKNKEAVIKKLLREIHNLKTKGDAE